MSNTFVFAQGKDQETPQHCDHTKQHWNLPQLAVRDEAANRGRMTWQ